MGHALDKKAFESKDWGGAFDQFDPSKSDQLVLGGLMMAAFSCMSNKAAEPELKELTKKHGVAENPGKDSLKEVKDLRGLFVDLMKFTEKHSKPGEEAKMEVSGELKDVTIDGDKAKGTFTKKDGKTETMIFIRLGGRWYISMDR